MDCFFFYLPQFLGQTLTLEGNVDLSLIDNMHIETSCASRGRPPGSPLFHIRNALHIGAALDRLLVLYDLYAALCVMVKQPNWHLDTRFYFQVQADLAHTHNQA